MSNIKVGKSLDCGCCGLYFHTWEGYVDQDQDQGYGICKECQGGIAERNIEEEDKLIACIQGAFESKETNDRFASSSREDQLAFAYSMLDKGVIKYSFGS